MKTSFKVRCSKRCKGCAASPFLEDDYLAVIVALSESMQPGIGLEMDKLFDDCAFVYCHESKTVHIFSLAGVNERFERITQDYLEKKE